MLPLLRLPLLHQEVAHLLRRAAEIRNQLIPKVKPLYESAVSASNQRREEIALLKTSTEAWAKRFGRISIWLYVIGSIVALLGQFLDKTKPDP